MLEIPGTYYRTVADLCHYYSADGCWNFLQSSSQCDSPHLLDEDDLLAANSISWSTGRFVQIIGSALALGVIQIVGAEAAFVFNALTFFISALLLPLLPIPPGRHISTQGRCGFLADARDGLRFARQDRFVSRLVIVQALASLSVGATSALLVVLAQEHYRLPPGGFGSFILAIGVGTLLGLLAREYRHPRWLFGPYVVRGVGDMLLAVVAAPPLAWLLLFIYGLNTSSGMVVYQIWVQRELPDAMRGRVFTWLDVVWNVMKVVSLDWGGWLAEQAGVEMVYYLGGAMLVLAGLSGIVALRDEWLTSGR
ncbi:MAG: MFS transporter [Anaerolineae bacterium]|nr:MFS transporter [Anaerolineae bacterium]